MIATEENLQNKTVEELIKLIEEKNKTIQNTLNENKVLRHKLQLYLHNKFAAQSEKNENPYQACLFDEAEMGDAELKQDGSEKEKTAAVLPEAKKRGRKPLPKSLVRVRKEYDLADNEKQCDCGCELTKIGEDVSEQLEFIPAKVQVIQHVKFKYACKVCEDTIKTAKPPKLPIPKSIASAGLLAHTLVSKYEDHLPLYRQERIVKRMGIDIPRNTMANWVIRCGTLFDPLINLMQRYFLNYDIGYADETPIQVLKEPGKLATSQSYM